MTRWLLALVCCCAGGVAVARGPLGALSLIRAPHGACPVAVMPGEPFDVLLEEEATLRLVDDDGSVDIPCRYEPLPDGRVRALCHAPKDVDSGLYTLEASRSGQRDWNERAVFVCNAFPESYRFAHVSDVRIGSSSGRTTAAQRFRALFADLADNGPAFLVVTGSLTEDGTLEQFQEFLAALADCPLPTWVCPGTRDRLRGNCRRFLEDGPYAFRFGQDAYTIFENSAYAVDPDVGTQAAELHLLRRKLRAARWSIGVTNRFDADVDFRTQITLFADNPLDVLVGGAESDPESDLPWQRTKFVVSGSAQRLSPQLFAVSPGAVSLDADRNK